MEKIINRTKRSVISQKRQLLIGLVCYVNFTANYGTEFGRTCPAYSSIIVLQIPVIKYIHTCIFYKKLSAQFRQWEPLEGQTTKVPQPSTQTDSYQNLSRQTKILIKLLFNKHTRIVIRELNTPKNILTKVFWP